MSIPPYACIMSGERSSTACPRPLQLISATIPSFLRRVFVFSLRCELPAAIAHGSCRRWPASSSTCDSSSLSPARTPSAYRFVTILYLFLPLALVLLLLLCSPPLFLGNGQLECFVANLLFEVPLPPPGATLAFTCTEPIILHSPHALVASLSLSPSLPAPSSLLPFLPSLPVATRHN